MTRSPSAAVALPAMRGRSPQRRQESAPRRGRCTRRRVVEAILARGPEESLDAVAARAGVAPAVLRRRLREPETQHALVEAVRDDLRAWLPVARDALLRKVLEGDKESLKIVLTVGGLLDAGKAPPEAAHAEPGPEALSDEELAARILALRRLCE